MTKVNEDENALKTELESHQCMTSEESVLVVTKDTLTIIINDLEMFC